MDPTTLLVGLKLAGVGALTCTEVEPWSLEVVDVADSTPLTAQGHSWRVACERCSLEVRVDPLALFGEEPAYTGAVLAWSADGNQLALQVDNTGMSRVFSVVDGQRTSLWEAQLDISELPDRDGRAEQLLSETSGLTATAVHALRAKRAWTLSVGRNADGLHVEIRDGRKVLAEGALGSEVLDSVKPVAGTGMHRVGLSSNESNDAVLQVALEGVAVPVPVVSMDVSVLAGALGQALKGDGLPLPQVTGPWQGAGCKLPDLSKLKPDDPRPDGQDPDRNRPDNPSPGAPASGLAAPGLAGGGPPQMPGTPGLPGPAGGSGSGPAASSGGAASGSPATTSGGQPASSSPSATAGPTSGSGAGSNSPVAAESATAGDEVVEATHDASDGPRTSRQLLLTGASVLAGAGASFAVSAQARSRFDNLDTDYPNLGGIQRTTNVSFGVGGGLTAVGLGLGVGAVVAGQW